VRTNQRSLARVGEWPPQLAVAKIKRYRTDKAPPELRYCERYGIRLP
jgi:hypothetical protein